MHILFQLFSNDKEHTWIFFTLVFSSCSFSKDWSSGANSSIGCKTREFRQFTRNIIIESIPISSNYADLPWWWRMLIGTGSMVINETTIQTRRDLKNLWNMFHTLGTLWISSYRLFKLRVSLRSAVPGVSLCVSAVPGPTSAGDTGRANGDSLSAIADFKGGTISGLHFSTRVQGNHSSSRLLSAATKTESCVITITVRGR